jgi:hypothetical protein
MREQLNTLLGFYRPSFFKMQVNHTDDLNNPNVLTDIPSAIYLHEYIHFLQDITTTYGFINISTVVDYIKFVNNFTRNGTSRIFSVPVIPKSSPNDEVFFNLKLKKEYVGSVDDIATATVTTVTKQSKTIALKNGDIDLDIVVIDYNDSGGNLHHHHFGSHCIIESMAYMIENSIYPNLLTSPPDFPYKSAQKIIETEYIAFLHNPLNALALCDVSLGAFNPGEFFFSMLSKMESENYLPPTPEDVYRYCSSNVTFNFNGATTLNQLLLSTSSIASNQLCDYFATSIFGDNNIWINYTIATAVNIRMTNPFFMLEIARGGKIQSNIPFMNVFKIVGTPMVSNLNDDGTFYSPLQTKYNIKPEYLWAISQIYGLYIKSLTNNLKKCELKLWCQASCMSQRINDFTNTNCYNSPWLRATDAQLCSFATMWKTWGMENEIPV